MMQVTLRTAVRASFFTNNPAPASGIDFSGVDFVSALGSGRIQIRRAIETKLGLARLFRRETPHR
jgi:hypothetical protein